MNESEVRRLRQQIKLLQRRLRRETLPGSGISRSAMQVLAALDRLDPGAQPGRLGEELQMTSSNVAAALRELEATRLVVRRRDEADGRRVLVHLTRSGRALLASTRSERDSWLGKAVEGTLSEREQRQLLRAGELIGRLAEFEA
ncbi:MAG TPA: MarR family transcriptional regulator [Solirubrobacterales bacterium]|jgi:DNA-binding MarR family transcriptional regulator